jgi:hypothetical protein
VTDKEVHALIVRLIEEKTAPLLARLDKVKDLVASTDAAFNLIESDPHQWSPRPCQTCSAVSAILGRPFGCSKKAQR